MQLTCRILKSRRIRYLIAGSWNTVFGYGIGVFLYYWLRANFHLLAIAIVANFLAITMAFLTYKLFVFRTQGNWASEYLRTYVVYGGTAILGIGMLWALVDGLGLPFWIAQGLVIVATVIISYVSHARFTFRQRAP